MSALTSLLVALLLPALQTASLPSQDGLETVIANFESGRFDDWTIIGNCWGPGPENSRFAGRTLNGWQGVYFLSSAHPRGPGWDAGSGTGRALSPTFRISGETIRFLIGGGKQYGKCGVRLLVDGQEVLSETGDSPFRMRPIAWDVRPYQGKIGQIEVFDNAATGAYAYVHVDDIVMIAPPPPPPTPAPRPVRLDPTPAPTRPMPVRVPSAATSLAATATVARPVPPPAPAIWEPFPTRLGPPPPIAPFTPDPLPTETVVVPIIFPILGGVPWHDNYNEDYFDSRGSHRHTAIDIQAPKMRPIVAPFSGTLGFKVNTFWIIGDNGFKCLGTHLNDDTPGTNDNSAQRDFMFAPNIRPGDQVIAGQFIGYVGNSGNASGPHLHFEIFTPDGIRNPAPSLRAAQRITTPRLELSPAPPTPSLGETLIIGCPRGFEPTRRVLTIQLVAIQKGGGKRAITTTPRRYYLKLTPEQVTEAGGVEGLERWPRDRTLYARGLEEKPGTSMTVRQLVPPRELLSNGYTSY